MGRFAETMSALIKAAPKFPSWGGQWGGSVNWFRGLPGQRDWSKIVGDGSNSSIVEACVLWICRNLPEAPLIVVDESKDVPEVIRRHELTKLMRRPNPYYSGVLLMYGLLTSWITAGDSYLIKGRDQLDRVRELWYAPHWMLEPRWPANDPNTFISHYDYYVDGKVYELPPRDVYHLRYGLDPNNTRKGRSPLRTLFLELGVDQEASNFSATILTNLGVPGVVLAPGKDVKRTIEKPERDAIKAEYQQEFGGDKRGSILVMSRQSELHQFGFSPKDLDLSLIRDVPEERVTAVLGIPAAVVGFQQQNSKVGATRTEERAQAYENCIIPGHALIGGELTTQMLPDFDPDEEHVVTFDVSKVRALAEAHAKVAEIQSTLVRSGIAERAEARAAVGLPVRPEDHVFMPSPGVQVFQLNENPEDRTAAIQDRRQLALAAQNEKMRADGEIRFKAAQPTVLTTIELVRDSSGRIAGINRKPIQNGNN